MLVEAPAPNPFKTQELHSSSTVYKISACHTLDFISSTWCCSDRDCGGISTVEAILCVSISGNRWPDWRAGQDVNVWEKVMVELACFTMFTALCNVSVVSCLFSQCVKYGGVRGGLDPPPPDLPMRPNFSNFKGVSNFVQKKKHVLLSLMVT